MIEGLLVPTIFRCAVGKGLRYVIIIFVLFRIRELGYDHVDLTYAGLHFFFLSKRNEPKKRTPKKNAPRTGACAWLPFFGRLGF